MINREMHGDFQFKFCWTSVMSCTTENFNEALKTIIFSVFEFIDEQMIPLMYVMDYNINVRHCRLGQRDGGVSVRVFPLGNRKWEATELKTEYNNLRTKFLLNGWTWRNAITTSIYNFKFLVHRGLNYYAEIEHKEGNKVSVKCGGTPTGRYETGVETTKPFFILPSASR